MISQTAVWAAVVALASLGVRSVAAAADDWQKLAAPRFTIVSQLRERETRDWAEEFDQFIDELLGFLQLRDPALRPVTVVLFKNRREFAPFRSARPDGEPAKVAGVFAARDTWGVIGLSRGGDEEWVRRVIFHEGFHWIANHDRRFYPVWVDEGLAEVFSTFRVSRGQARWGTPINAHVRQLRNQRMIPLRILLRVGRSDPLFNENDRSGMFYAQSWALAHYLLFGTRNDPRRTLAAYLNAIRSGKTVDETLHSVFDTDEEALERDLRRYVSRGKAVRLSRPVPSGAGREFVVSPAPPSEVDAALARLALGTDNLELARKHAAAAVRRAPGLAAGHEVLAWLASMDSREEEVGMHAERALACGSRDAWMCLFLASALQRSEEAKTASAGEVARAVANLMERAINLDSTLEAAYESLAAQMHDAEPVRPPDRTFLERGRARFPDNGRILMGLALLAERDDNRRELARLLEAADAADVKLPGWARNVRDRLRRQYIVDDIEPRVQELLKERKVDEALALYDMAIASATDARLRRQLESDRVNLEFEIKIKIARSFGMNGQLDKARRYYREILSLPGLQRSQESVAKSELREVERRRWEKPGALTAP